MLCHSDFLRGSFRYQSQFAQTHAFLICTTLCHLISERMYASFCASLIIVCVFKGLPKKNETSSLPPIAKVTLNEAANETTIIKGLKALDVTLAPPIQASIQVNVSFYAKLLKFDSQGHHQSYNSIYSLKADSHKPQSLRSPNGLGHLSKEKDFLIYQPALVTADFAVNCGLCE